MPEPTDEPVEPFSQLTPSDRKLLLDSGVPPKAISSDGRLDRELLRSQGWTVTDNFLEPPQDEFHIRLAAEHGERAANDPHTRRGYR